MALEYHYQELVAPVVFTFIALLSVSVLNIHLIARHHDRSFQLLSNIFLRLEIALPVVAPLIHVILWSLFIICVKAGMIATEVVAYGVFVYIPVVPVLLSTIPMAILCFLTRPGRRDAETEWFAARANSDQEMLLQQRGDGVPEVEDVLYSKNDARNIVDRHFSSIFWCEMMGLAGELVFVMPWMWKCLDFTLDFLE